jgi:hypothetical protein
VLDDAIRTSWVTVEEIDGDAGMANRLLVESSSEERDDDDDDSFSKCERASFLRRKATSSPPPLPLRSWDDDDDCWLSSFPTVHNSSHGWKGLLIDVLAYAALR